MQAESAPPFNALVSDDDDLQRTGDGGEPGKDTSLNDDPPRSSRKSSNACESAKTNTSTIEFEHEAFETYITRVKELCHSIWPDPPNKSRLMSILSKRVGASRRGQKLFRSILRSQPKTFHIDRLRGGGFNRIIGIDIIDPNKPKEEPERLILRVPRFEDAKPEREVAVLHYGSQHTTLPVPKIKSLDFTKDNSLNSPYVVNYRIPGHDLQHLGSGFDYPNLSHKQQCTVATEFAKALLQLQATTNAAPGWIEAASNGDGSHTFSVRPFEVSSEPSKIDGKLDELSHATNAPAFKSTLDFCLSQFQRWKDAGSNDMLKVMYMDRLSAVATQMATAGYLGDNRYTLCHLDLIQSPRNIMVKVALDQSLTISGLLDWDDAVFLPSFVGCVLPTWIWAWEGQIDDDENINDDEPVIDENKELQRLFEDAAGPKVVHQGRETGFRLARRIIPWALHGIHTTWTMKAADALIDDWAVYRPSEMPHIKRVLKADPDSYSLESTESEGSSIDELVEESDETTNREGSEGPPSSFDEESEKV